MVQLVLFRLLQGFGAGGVQPVAMTILGDIYTPAERARVQGVVSAVFGVSAVVGPSLGAFLVEHANWQLVFWVNLPIGAAAIAMIAAFLREDLRPRARRIDWLGSLLMLLAISALLLALVQQASMPRPLLLALTLGGLLALVGADPARARHQGADAAAGAVAESRDRGRQRRRRPGRGDHDGRLGFSAGLRAGHDGAERHDRRPGAGRDVGVLDVRQHLWRAADAAHQLPAGRGGWRPGAAGRLPAAGHADAGARARCGPPSARS
jgi:hypothetical protein